MTPDERRVLSFLKLVDRTADSEWGAASPTLCIVGANLQIVNGLGATNTTNGLGNLIVGYAETSRTADRSGSHNVVLGSYNQYTSHGGIVSGDHNALLGMNCTVLSSLESSAGGRGRNAVLAGYRSDVRGDGNAILADDFGVIQNASFNAMIGSSSSVIRGGSFNDVICGGQGHLVENTSFSSVSGGIGTTLLDSGAIGALGGALNQARLAPNGGTLVGGANNVLDGSGGSGAFLYPTIVGGEGNAVTEGEYSTVVGGL